MSTCKASFAYFRYILAPLSVCYDLSLMGIMGLKRKVENSIYRLKFFLVSKIFCLISASLFLSQLATGQELNPLDGDPRAARVGGSIFRAQCATCHGADAKGIDSIDAPDLTLLYTGSGTSDESVFNTIRDGVSGSIMPAHTFPDTEIWMLVSYLRSVALSGISTEVDGDPVPGELLFIQNCSTCHRRGDQGGALGPNLSRITQVRSLEALINSVRSPSATIARGYKPVLVTTEDNEQVQGVIQREDAFSIQIMDTDQYLRGFSKISLREINYEEQSWMPVFSESELTNQDLNNIISFLQSSL